MKTSALVGSQVDILVSDPWDFVTEHGAGPFKAQVLQVNDSRPEEQGLLVQLEQPLIDKGVRLEYFVVSPRHADSDLASLARGQILTAAVNHIPPDRLDPTPFDLSWWRGGVYLIGSVTRPQSP